MWWKTEGERGTWGDAPFSSCQKNKRNKRFYWKESWETVFIPVCQIVWTSDPVPSVTTRTCGRNAFYSLCRILLLKILKKHQRSKWGKQKSAVSSTGRDGTGECFINFKPSEDFTVTHKRSFYRSLTRSTRVSEEGGVGHWGKTLASSAEKS